MGLPLRSSQPAGSEGLEEARRKDTNSTPSAEIDSKGHDDYFLGQRWRSAHRLPDSRKYNQWSILCITHRAAAFYYPGETARQSQQGVLLLHDNAPVHKSNVVQATIRQAGFAELNHPAYSPDIAPTDYHMFSHLKKFLRGKSFGSDDEVIATVETYLRDLDSGFFSTGIESLHDRWLHVVAIEGQYIQ